MDTPKVISDDSRTAPTIEPDSDIAWRRATDMLAGLSLTRAESFSEQQVVFYALRDSVRRNGIALCLNGVLSLVAHIRVLEAALAKAEGR
jgi:hypothetical protein